MEEHQNLQLLEKAKKVSQRAYAPYSQFKVGCAIFLHDGRIIEGVNVENASFPVTISAQRVAMAQVVSLGLQEEIAAIAVATKSSPLGFPCGMCRAILPRIS